MTPPPFPGPEKRKDSGRFSIRPNQSIISTSSSVQDGQDACSTSTEFWNSTPSQPRVKLTDWILKIYTQSIVTLIVRSLKLNNQSTVKHTDWLSLEAQHPVNLEADWLNGSENRQPVIRKADWLIGWFRTLNIQSAVKLTGWILKLSTKSHPVNWRDNWQTDPWNLISRQPWNWLIDSCNTTTSQLWRWLFILDLWHQSTVIV